MAPSSQSSAAAHPSSSGPLILILAWLAVGVPLLWGVAATLKKALALFA